MILCKREPYEFRYMTGEEGDMRVSHYCLHPPHLWKVLCLTKVVVEDSKEMLNSNSNCSGYTKGMQETS